MKSTTRAFRWLGDSGVLDVVDPFSELKGYLVQISGLKKLMIDCVVLIVSRIQLSHNDRNHPERYKFENALVEISDAWERECNYAHSRVIDLTCDSIYTV